MTLWMLVLVVSAVLPADSTLPLDKYVIETQNFIKDNKKVANILMPLYASTAAHAILLVELESAESKMPSLAEAQTESKKENALKAKVDDAVKTVKSATAAMFLLLINRDRYSNISCDRRNDFDCVLRYHRPKVEHGKGHISKQTKTYEAALDKSDWVTADAIATTIFDNGRENYEANTCNDLSAFVLNADEIASNVVVEKLVDLLEKKFNAETTAGGETGSIQRVATDTQYQHDLHEFNAMVKVIRKNHPIDWDALKWSIKKAIAAIKAGDGTHMCEHALKPVKIIDELIDNAQRDLMIYLPYKLPDIKLNDVQLLQQLWRGYQKAFNSQTELLRGNDARYKNIMKEIDDRFESTVRTKKMEALKIYLKELNVFGETYIMPPRFLQKGKFDRRLTSDTTVEYLWRSIEPNVSFLPRLPWCLDMENRSSSLIVKWGSRKDLHKFIEDKIEDLLSKSKPDSHANDFRDEMRGLIAKHGGHIVYYYAWERDADFYKKEFEAARAELEKKQHDTPLTIQLKSFPCHILSDIYKYINAYYFQECENTISDIGMFRKLMMMLQYVDAHTAHISAGLENKSDEIVNRIYEHVRFATTKYEKVLSEQLDAATYLDEGEIAHLQQHLKTIVDELNESEVKKVITQKVTDASNNHQHKMNEKMCRAIYADVVKDHQMRLAATVSSMVYAPIVLEGNFYLSDIIIIFYGVQKVDDDGANLVWEYLQSVVHKVVKDFVLLRRFLFDEEHLFEETALAAITKLKANYKAQLRDSGFECQLQLEAHIRQFYVQFADMIRSMRTKAQFKKRVLDGMATWLNGMAQHNQFDHDRIIQDAERYVTPLLERLSRYVESESGTTPNEADVVSYTTDVTEVERAQEVRFKNLHGSFVESLKHHIDQRTAPIFAITDPSIRYAQAEPVPVESKSKLSKRDRVFKVFKKITV